MIKKKTRVNDFSWVWRNLGRPHWTISAATVGKASAGRGHISSLYEDGWRAWWTTRLSERRNSNWINGARHIFPQLCRRIENDAGRIRDLQGDTDSRYPLRSLMIWWWMSTFKPCRITFTSAPFCSATAEWSGTTAQSPGFDYQQSIKHCQQLPTNEHGNLMIKLLHLFMWFCFLWFQHDQVNPRKPQR